MGRLVDGMPMTSGSVTLLRRRARVAHASMYFAGLVLSVAAFALVGAAAHRDLLALLVPGTPPVDPRVAAMFVLSAVSLWMLRTTMGPSARQRWLARGSAALVIAAGVLQMLLHVSALHAGTTTMHAGATQAAMQPNVAKNFILLGLGLLLADVTTRRGRRPNEFFAVAVLLIALLAMLGHAYGITAVFRDASFMPLPIAAGFFLLALGTLCARPGQGLMHVVTSDGAGGAAARTLLPSAALLLLVLGWLRLQGERHGFYAADLGVTLYTFAFMTIFGALIWASARSLHRMELQRDAIEAERKRFFAVSSDLLYIAGFDGFLKSLNPAWTALLGFPEAEFFARPYVEFVHPEDRESTLAALHLIEAGSTQLSYENRCRAADGSYRWISWRATTVEEEALIYGSGRDITEQKRADSEIRSLNAELAANTQKLEQSNRELEAFSYTISHDLRAPLRHIDGYARMLKEDGGDQLAPELIRYTGVISDSARHMGALIDDLLAFSRLGRKTLELTRIDSEDLIRRALHEASGGHPIAAEIRVGALPDAHADPVLFRQVWVNLLANALKYSARRGSEAVIEISGERDAGMLRYRIRDNGVGFDMRYADKLFGVFQRMHGSDEFEGTGVGLAIVHRALQRHGGGITAHAEPGKGATFTFEIPAEDTAR